MYSKDQIDNIWEEYYPKAYGFFFKRLRNTQDLEDLVASSMNTFALALLEKDILQPKAFFWKIIKNNYLAYLKDQYHNQRKNLMSYDHQQLELLATDKSLIKFKEAEFQLQLQEVLKEAKEILTDLDYKILHMAIWENQKFSEIAISLDLKSGTVRQKFSRTVIKLKKIIQRNWSHSI